LEIINAQWHNDAINDHFQIENYLKIALLKIENSHKVAIFWIEDGPSNPFFIFT